MFNDYVDFKMSFYPIPLELEIRSVLSTQEAAYHLNRADQTLRLWAMNGSGPLKPLRIAGRLAWPTDEIRKLLGVVADLEPDDQGDFRRPR